MTQGEMPLSTSPVNKNQFGRSSLNARKRYSGMSPVAAPVTSNGRFEEMNQTSDEVVIVNRPLQVSPIISGTETNKQRTKIMKAWAATRQMPELRKP